MNRRAGGETSEDDVVREQLVERERLLLHPGPTDDTAALFGDGFVEIGASGRRWDRGEVIDLVEARRGVGVGDYVLSEVSCRPLGADVHLLTYALRTDSGRSRRTSIWTMVEGSWQLLHHQGTPVPD